MGFLAASGRQATLMKDGSSDCQPKSSYFGHGLRAFIYEATCLGNRCLSFRAISTLCRLRASLLTNPLPAHLSRCRHEISSCLTTVLPANRAVSMTRRCPMTDLRQHPRGIKRCRSDEEPLPLSVTTRHLPSPLALQHGSNQLVTCPGRCARSRLLQSRGLLLLV